VSCAKVPCALAFSGCPSQAASGRFSGAKVPHAKAWLAVCPLAVSAWLFATAEAVAKAARHRGFATVTWCVWRVSWAGSGANLARSLARPLRRSFDWSGPLHEHEFMQTERATKRSTGIVSRPWKLVKIGLQSQAFAQRAPAKSEARTEGANAARLSNQVVGRAVTVALAHKPNESFNADANTGHRFAPPSVGTLRLRLRRRLTRALGFSQTQAIAIRSASYEQSFRQRPSSHHSYSLLSTRQFHPRLLGRWERDSVLC
jgi:hypothetical protein